MRSLRAHRAAARGGGRRRARAAGDHRSDARPRRSLRARCASVAARSATRRCSRCTTCSGRTCVGAGPLEPLLRLPGVTDVLVNGCGRGLRRPRRGPRAAPGPVRRRRGRAPAGAAAGGVGRPTTRRRHAVRRPPAARRHQVPRGARTAVASRHGDLAASAAAPCVHARRAGGQRHRHLSRRLAAGAAGRVAAGVPGQRRHRLGEDHLAVGPALPGRPGTADRDRRGRQRAAPRPSARRRSRVTSGERGGRGGGADAGAGQAGAADAARPARRRRGARRRGEPTSWPR